jgi:pimeloyl-ACP methyl ester carboxylesterase
MTAPATAYRPPTRTFGRRHRRTETVTVPAATSSRRSGLNCTDSTVRQRRAASSLPAVEIERGVLGLLPYASTGARTGSGPPVVVLAGLSHTTGIAADGFVRSVLAPVRQLADRRRLIVLNRRPGLPAGLTMAQLAAEHADAIAALGEPADVLGTSTGGSIAQQLAADHPDSVRRLVLLSAAHRLGDDGRSLQAQIAADLRAGRTRRAMGLAASDLAVRGLRTVSYGLGYAAANRIITTPLAAADLAATIEAEDEFELAKCNGSIEAPTLIVAGGRDYFYGAELFRETAALIPHSQLHLDPRRGHITVAHDRRARAVIAGFLTWQAP